MDPSLYGTHICMPYYVSTAHTYLAAVLVSGGPVAGVACRPSAGARSLECGWFPGGLGFECCRCLSRNRGHAHANIPGMNFCIITAAASCTANMQSHSHDMPRVHSCCIVCGSCTPLTSSRLSSIKYKLLFMKLK